MDLDHVVDIPQRRWRPSGSGYMVPVEIEVTVVDLRPNRRHLWVGILVALALLCFGGIFVVKPSLFESTFNRPPYYGLRAFGAVLLVASAWAVVRMLWLIISSPSILRFDDDALCSSAWLWWNTSLQWRQIARVSWSRHPEGAIVHGERGKVIIWFWMVSGLPDVGKFQYVAERVNERLSWAIQEERGGRPS